MQMILILTKSINRCFEKNPKFDMTPLLGGTDVVFSSLIHSFNWLVFLPSFGLPAGLNFFLFHIPVLLAVYNFLVSKIRTFVEFISYVAILCDPK